ncbi:hypothetical protein VNI00_002216 [Paramarasmius palmivorus]|uniref:FAD-binding domain-containing protein n=1 Tax=Paramarasmius palmivorus TaxID=297713 RepID=A0AAW0E464_9AGAR
MPLKDFSVAVVGGGVCGLAAAYALSRAGPNAIRALEVLGLLQPLLSRVGPSELKTRFTKFISGSARHELIFDYETAMAHPEKHAGLGLHRAVFLDMLLDLLNPSTIHLQKRCIEIEPRDSGGVVISFADGSTYEADVVIGADGIRSVTRDFVIGQESPSPLVFTNTVAYRGLANHDELIRSGIQSDLGKGPLYFISPGKINLVAFASDHQKPLVPELPLPWVDSVSKEEVKNTFSECGPDTKILIDHLNMPNKWSIHACMPPLTSYVRGKVVLVGDAAHGMLPFLGAGAGQGIEDVVLLTELLAHAQTRKDNIKDVLAVYDIVRPPRANYVLEASTRAGQIYGDTNPVQDDFCKMARQLERIWGHDIGEDVVACIQMLCDRGIFASNTSE